MTQQMVRPPSGPSPEQPGRAAGTLALPALVAIVVGSMIGSGIFALPSQMAGSAAPGPLLIGWLITGVGMLMLAFVFQTLSRRKPEVDGGVYGYARAGFGNYLGFTSAWGYWISAWIGNVGYLVLLMSTMGYFIPAFEGGNTVSAVVCASVVLWVLHWLTTRGVHNAAFVNTLVTIAKVVPIVTFIAIAAVGFKAGIFTADVWGDSQGLGSTLDQVKNMMLVTVWVFIGIEGASVYSQRAAKRSDVGRATVIGFVGVLGLLLAVNLLSYGLMSQAKIAGLDDPSMAGLMRHEVGAWGTGFISAGLAISLLGALLSWILLCVEILRLPAQEGILPRQLGAENHFGAPSNALWLTNGCVQLMLLWTLVNDSTYTDLIYLATSLILLPYLWSALYQVKLALTGETYGEHDNRTRDIVVGLVALTYAVWLVYAGGWKYVLVAGIFYLVGTGLYVWARKQVKAEIFTMAERVVVAVVAALAVAGVVGLIQGFVTI